MIDSSAQKAFPDSMNYFISNIEAVYPELVGKTFLRDEIVVVDAGEAHTIP